MYKLLTSKEECYVFVAGNGKNMPTAVKNVFISIYEKLGHLNYNFSKNIIDMKESQGFYQTETWS